MPAPLLFEARDLRKRYGATTVVDGLSFSIAAGECLGVIGPNGAGKTTTVRMCLGQTTPDAGRCTTTRRRAVPRWRCRATRSPSRPGSAW